jgi:predicted kinase
MQDMPNAREAMVVAAYNGQFTGPSPLMRLPGEELARPELHSSPDLTWGEWWAIQSLTSFPGAVGQFLHEKFTIPGYDLDFDGYDYIRGKYGTENPDVRLAIEQGWFDLAFSPEQAEHRLALARQNNVALGESYRMSYGEMGLGMLAQLIGDPVNLAGGIGLARLGYKGVSGIKALQGGGKALAGRTAATAGAGAAGNLAFEQALNELNPSTEIEGAYNEIFAASLGGAFGAAIPPIGHFVGRPAIKGASNKLMRFREKRLQKAMETVADSPNVRREADIDTPYESAELVTIKTSLDESEADLDMMLTAQEPPKPQMPTIGGRAVAPSTTALTVEGRPLTLEGRQVVAPLRPADPKHPVNVKLRQLADKANREGWQLEVVAHPDQEVLTLLEQVVEISNSARLNRIATQGQLDGSIADQTVSGITGLYSRAQSVVTPGARTAGRAVAVIEDFYRTVSGSAHTITEQSATQAFTARRGASAEGITSQLRKRAESLTSNLDRIYRRAKKDKNSGGAITYDGQPLNFKMLGGQDEFEGAVTDYLRRKHAKAMGYDVKMPEDVHPLILEAADRVEKYFDGMGDQLVRAGILDAENGNLGRYFPVVYDPKKIRRNPIVFVDTMARALEERDLRGRTVDELEVDEDIASQMNRDAGRDVFASHRDPDDLPDAPAPREEPEPAAPPKDPLDEAADRARAEIAEAMDRAPEQDLTPLRGYRDDPFKAPDDVAAGGYPGAPVRYAFGKETVIRFGTGESIPGYWAVVEAPDLNPSNNVYGGRTAEGGFPRDPVYGAFNERAGDYADPTGGSNSMEVNQAMVRNPDHGRFTALDTSTEYGTPIVTLDGYPDSGANRTMAMQQIHDGLNGAKPEDAVKLKQAVRDAASEAGIDPKVVDGFEKPVLVRVMKDPGDPGSMSTAANRRAAATQSKATEAAARSQKISDGTFAFLNRHLDESGDDLTFRAALDQGDFGLDLMIRLQKDGVIDSNDFARMWNTKANKFTPEGKDYVQSLMAARVIQDFETPSYLVAGKKKGDPPTPRFGQRVSRDEVLSRARPQARERWETASPLVMTLGQMGFGRNAHPRFNGGLAYIDDAWSKALLAHGEWKDSGLTFDDYFFNQIPQVPHVGFDTPMVAAFVHALDTMGPRKLRAALKEANSKIRVEDADGPTMFTGDPLNPYEVLHDVLVGADGPASLASLRNIQEPMTTNRTMRVEAETLRKFETQGSTVRQHTDENGVFTPERQELHNQIVEDMMGLRVESDENAIKPGVGGGRAETPRAERQVVFLTGPAAAGKSTMAESIQSSQGAYIVDSDFIKRKLPEFEDQGAFGTHDESKLILNRMIDQVIEGGSNAIIPKVGTDQGTLSKMISRFADAGYDVHVVTVDMPPRKVMERLSARSIHTGRHIPHGMVANDYADNPTRTWREVNKNGGYWELGEGRRVKLKSMGLYTADVPRTNKAKFDVVDPDSWLDDDALDMVFKGGLTTRDMAAKVTPKGSPDVTTPDLPVAPRRGAEAPAPGPQRVRDGDVPPADRADGAGRPPRQRGDDARPPRPERDADGAPRAQRKILVGSLDERLRAQYLDRLRQRYREQATNIRDAITDPVRGHGVAAHMQAVPRPLRERSLGINYATVQDFLDDGLQNQVMRYDYNVAGHIGVRRAIQQNSETWDNYRTSDGRKVETADDLADVLDTQFNRMRALAERAGDLELANKIASAHAKARRDLVTPMQAMTGQMPNRGLSDPDSFLSFFGRTVQRYNFMNKLGSVGWAQLNDLAPITLYLLQNPRSLAQFPRLIGLMKNFSRKDLELFQLWTDHMTRTRAITDQDFDVRDLGYGAGKARVVSAMIEHGSTRLSEVSSHLSGMNWITNTNKRLAGMLTFERMTTLSKKMIRAKKLMDDGMSEADALKKVRMSKYQLAKVNQLGLNVERAELFHAQTYAKGTLSDGRAIREVMSFDDYMRNEKKLFVNGFAEWDMNDVSIRDLLETIQARVDDEVNRHLVVTPGVFDRPLVNFNTWGKLLNQFQTFMMAFQHQRMLPMSQMPAKYQLWYLTTYMALGATTDAITNHLSGRRKLSESAEEWKSNPAGMAYKAFVYSGLSGPISRAWGLTDALGVPVSPGVLFDNRVGGGASQGFYSGDAGARAVIQGLGPTASTADRMGDILYDVAGPGEVDDQTYYKAATMLPFQNQAILRMLYRATDLPVVPEAFKR